MLARFALSCKAVGCADSMAPDGQGSLTARRCTTARRSACRPARPAPARRLALWHTRRQAAQLRVLTCSLACICTLVADCAGEYVPDRAWLLGVVQAVMRYCEASTALAVDLFCDGALGSLLRIAHRVVAALPHAARYGFAQQAVVDFLAPLVKAFALAVHQARAVPRCLSSLCAIYEGFCGA